MKKAIKRLIALTMLSASLALTAFTGCGESKPEIKQNLKYDVTDKTEAFFIDADQASAVSIDGKLLTADEYVVKNGYILLDEGIYASLGKGEHAIALTADGKTTTFKLTVTDDADLSYVLPEIADVVFVGSSLPKVSFFNDVQSREVVYSLKINGAECALTDDGQLNHINSLAAGDCEYSIKITRNGKEIENKVYRFKTTDNVVALSGGAGVYFGEKALSIAKDVDSKNDNVPCIKLERTSWDAASFVFNNEFVSGCIEKGLTKVTLEYRLDYVHPNVSSANQSAFNPQIYNSQTETSVLLGNNFGAVTASTDYRTASFTFKNGQKLLENESFRISTINFTAVFYVKSITFSRG